MISERARATTSSSSVGTVSLTSACHFTDLRNFDTNMVTKRQGVVREVY